MSAELLRAARVSRVLESARDSKSCHGPIPNFIKHQLRPDELRDHLGVFWVLADAAFDSETKHCQTWEELGIRSSAILINPRGSHTPPIAATGRLCPRHFRTRADGSRHKRVFGQRRQVERAFRRQKRRL